MDSRAQTNDVGIDDDDDDDDDDDGEDRRDDSEELAQRVREGFEVWGGGSGAHASRVRFARGRGAGDAGTERTERGD